MMGSGFSLCRGTPRSSSTSKDKSRAHDARRQGRLQSWSPAGLGSSLVRHHPLEPWTSVLPKWSSDLHAAAARYAPALMLILIGRPRHVLFRRHVLLHRSVSFLHRLVRSIRQCNDLVGGSSGCALSTTDDWDRRLPTQLGMPTK